MLLLDIYQQFSFEVNCIIFPFHPWIYKLFLWGRYCFPRYHPSSSTTKLQSSVINNMYCKSLMECIKKINKPSLMFPYLTLLFSFQFQLTHRHFPCKLSVLVNSKENNTAKEIKILHYIGRLADTQFQLALIQYAFKGTILCGPFLSTNNAILCSKSDERNNVSP